MKALMALAFIFLWTFSSGQSVHLIDSLELNLDSYGPNDKSWALYNLVSYYQRSDREKTLKFRSESQKFLKDSSPKAQTYARIVEGIYNTGTGSLDSAVYWFSVAKESAQKSGDTQTIAIVCNGLGRTLITAGKAKDAVSNLMEGLRITDKNPRQELAMKMRVNLVFAYLELKRYQDGVNLGRQSLVMLDEPLKWIALHFYKQYGCMLWGTQQA